MTGLRILSEAELDLVSGGVRDNPDSDRRNAQAAAQNAAEGTLGGSLNDVIPGLVGPGAAQGAPPAPNTPGRPFDPN